jgi:hypothetical protein
MEANQGEWSLERLLICCSDHKHSEYEKAWRIFLRRYKTFIYQVVTHRCICWRVSRLKRQLSDTVNDIVSEVFAILTKSLSQYKEVGNEKKFRLWLGTICNRAAGRYIKREFFSDMADEDLEEFRNYIKGIECDSRWELYESVIQQLRETDSGKKKNLERDINLFQLYIWSDLSQPIILSHPCYVSVGHRVIDNVVNRLREQIKTQKNRSY